MSLRSFPGMVVAITIGLLFFPVVAAAQSVRYVDIDAAGANDGTTWQDAYNDLGDALADAAGAAGAVTQIWVANGTYSPAGPGGFRTATFQLVDNVAVFGGFAGGESALEDRNVALNVTVLSGDLNGNDGANFVNNTENSYHVVTGTGNDATAVLDGFTVSGGNANSGSGNDRGAGIKADGVGGPTIANCTVADNSASFGGGLFTGQSNAPTLVSCTFENNRAILQGGGVFAQSSVQPTRIIDCIFRDNTSLTGGGAVLQFAGQVMGCLFVGNTAAGPESPNTSVAGGGGLFALNVGTLFEVVNCTFVANSARRGGGMHVFSTPVSTPKVSNCIFWDNTATFAGDQFIRIGSVFPQFANNDIQGSGGSGPGWDADLGADADGNIDALPLFVSPNTDLRLTSASPAIDAGDQTLVPTQLADDLDGNVRICGEVDMGAYEFPAGGLEITCPAAETLACPASIDPLDTGFATAIDNCSGNAVPVGFVDDALAGCGSTQTITRTWTTDDGSSNPASCNQSIEVNDTTPPVLTVDTQPIAVTDTDCSGDEPAALPTAVSIDACDGPVAVTDDAPTVFSAGQTTSVTFSTEDACGNASNATLDVTVAFGADVLVRAIRHTVGPGSHPGATKEPLPDIEACAYDAAELECARNICGGVSHQQYQCIVDNCTPDACETTDALGEAELNLDPGDYIVIAADDTATVLPDPLGKVVGDLLCGELRIARLRQLVRFDGRKKPAKTRVETGSLLLIVEPEFIVWDQPEQPYPFVFESIGEWGVTATIAPPEGFVADYESLAADVDNELEAVQFTITETGSDLVPTETTFELIHNGEIRTVRSSIDILLTPEYARSRGFNVAALRAGGLIKEVSAGGDGANRK